MKATIKYLIAMYGFMIESKFEIIKNVTFRAAVPHLFLNWAKILVKNSWRAKNALKK